MRLFPPAALNSLIIRNGSTTPFIASSIKSFVPFGRVSRGRPNSGSRHEYMIRPRGLATNASPSKHGPPRRVGDAWAYVSSTAAHSQEFSVASRTWIRRCVLYILRRDIFSSRAFLSFLLRFSFFFANTCFEAGHAFSKAIRLGYYIIRINVR